MERPTGVTILAVLAIIGGVLGLLAGFGLMGLGAVGVATTAGDAAVGSGMAAVLGGGLIIASLINLVFGIGAWMLKGWAWILGVIGQILSLVFSLIAILTGSGVLNNLIGMIIPAIILYYLNTPLVKRAFGRA